MWYVYLLSCADGEIYKGSAKNETKRIECHQNGQVESTKEKLLTGERDTCPYIGELINIIKKSYSFCSRLNSIMTVDKRIVEI